MKRDIGRGMVVGLALLIGCAGAAIAWRYLDADHPVAGWLAIVATVAALACCGAVLWIETKP